MARWRIQDFAIAPALTKTHYLGARRGGNRPRSRRFGIECRIVKTQEMTVGGNDEVNLKCRAGDEPGHKICPQEGSIASPSLQFVPFQMWPHLHQAECTRVVWPTRRPV